MCPKPNNKGKAKKVNNGAGPSKPVNKGKAKMVNNGAGPSKPVNKGKAKMANNGAGPSKFKVMALAKAKQLQNEKVKLDAGKKMLKPTSYIKIAKGKTKKVNNGAGPSKPVNKGKAKMVNNGAGPSKPLNKGKAKMVNNGAGPSKINNDTLFTAINMTSNFNNGFDATQNNFGFNINNGLGGNNINYGNDPGNDNKTNAGLKFKDLVAANFTYYKEGQTEDPIKLLKKSMTAAKKKSGTKMYKKIGAKQMATKGGPLELIPVSQIKKPKNAHKITVPPKKPVQFMKFNKPVNKDPTKSIPTQPAKMIITADKISDANKILAKKMAWSKMKVNNTGENYERYVKNAMNKIMASKSQ
jgi:hypothetical protein